MKTVSLFAGIGGFDLAFQRAGIETVAQVEIDANCRKILESHFPDAKRFEDVRAFNRSLIDGDVDIVCGGFPCQDLSVAGLRAGFAGKRSSLFFEMVRIVNEYQPSFLIWENVPGLFSSNHGRDFASVLVALDAIGYSGAWTVLDAQHFGLAQRRRRIFGVFARADIGAGACAEILSIRSRLRGNIAESGEAGEGIAATITERFAGGSNQWAPRNEADNLIALPIGGQIARRGGNDGDGVISFAWQQGVSKNDRSYPVRAGDYAGSVSATRTDAIAFDLARITSNVNRTRVEEGLPASTLNQAGQMHVAYGGNNTKGEIELATACNAHGGSGRMDFESETFVKQQTGVRRLTPTECERLQGFPDGWTDGQSDSVRYRQLGNAVAVSCVEWIARRLITETTKQKGLHHA